MFQYLWNELPHAWEWKHFMVVFETVIAMNNNTELLKTLFESDNTDKCLTVIPGNERIDFITTIKQQSDAVSK